MPRIPSEFDLGGLPDLNSRRPIATYDGTAIGRGVAALGQGITSAGDSLARVQERDDTLDVARAKANFLTQKIQLDSEFANDQGYTDLTKRYQDRLKAIQDESESYLNGNPRKKELFSLSVSDDVAKGVAHTTTLARKQEADANVADANTRLQGIRDAALKSQDDAERGKLIGSGKEIIDGLEQRGFITREGARSTWESFRKDYAKAWVGIQPLDKQIEMLRSAPLSEDQEVNRILGVEGVGKNANSSAEGVGQFTKQTWLDTIKKYRPDIAEGRDDAELLALRKDGPLGKQMTTYLMRENATALEGAGVPATSGNKYLAHFLGAQAAAAVAKAAPGTPVYDVLAESVGPKKAAAMVNANLSVLGGKTAGTVTQWAANKMGAAGPSPADFLSYSDRVDLLQKGEVTMAANVKAAEAQAEKDRKAFGDEMLKEAFARSAEGKLTGDFIERARPFITPDAYKGLLKAMGPDAAEDDPAAVADLTKKIDTVTPDEFTKAATAYLGQNKLKTGTFISLSEKNRAASKDDQPASPYRSGRDLVKTTLEPGQLLSGPAAAVARSAQAQALTEFDNWAQANPRATREDYQAQGQDIIKRYQVVPFDQMKLATGVSRYFGNKARDQVTAQDVDAAEEKLAADIQSGAMTKAQQEFEIRLLGNWREILAKEAAQPKGNVRGK